MKDDTIPTRSGDADIAPTPGWSSISCDSGEATSETLGFVHERTQTAQAGAHAHNLSIRSRPAEFGVASSPGTIVVVRFEESLNLTIQFLKVARYAMKRQPGKRHEQSGENETCGQHR